MKPQAHPILIRELRDARLENDRLRVSHAKQMDDMRRERDALLEELDALRRFAAHLAVASGGGGTL
jgi:hypothetical protein